MAGRILIVDDDRDIAVTLGDRLRAAGHEVLIAADGSEGLRRMRDDDPDVVLLDLQMPQMNGMQVLEQAASEALESTVVVITAHGSIERAVEAMRAGAFDFIAKPFEPQRIGIVVDKALERDRLRRENALLREQSANAVPTLIGDSLRMRAVVAMARRAAGSTATVLILGKTGSGKEVLARNTHHWSERRNAPFVVVNCVALSEQLLESELFGHERGGFTGAERLRRGRFELARGGTIFLDEIGVTRPDFQLKLLRVLQDGTFSRVGGEKELTTDARIVAATSRDLERAVAEGEFLADLYYRLKVVQIEMPDLCERRDDIPALAEFFLEKHAARVNREIGAITPAAMQYLLAYEWPGCVRELENTIERAAVLGTGTEIDVADLPEEVLGASGAGATGTAGGEGGDYQSAVRDFKRQLVERALARTGGNQTEAAELLSLHRTYLSKLMKDLGLR